MTKNRLIKRLKFQMFAGIAAGLLLEPASAVQASPPPYFGVPSTDFSSIAQNMTISVEDLPGLLTGLAYLLGLLLGASAILKMKDHIENPTNTPLKDSTIRMASGGALFALPIIFEAMTNTSGNNGAGASAAILYKASFNVQ